MDKTRSFHCPKNFDGRENDYSSFLHKPEIEELHTLYYINLHRNLSIKFCLAG